jgi:hypothetical protein
VFVCLCVFVCVRACARACACVWGGRLSVIDLMLVYIPVGCNAASLCNLFWRFGTTWWSHLQGPKSHSIPLKMKPVRCLEMWGSNHPVTRHNILEEQSLQLHRCENLKKNWLNVDAQRDDQIHTCYSTTDVLSAASSMKCYKRIPFVRVQRVVRFGSVWRSRTFLTFLSSSFIAEKISCVQLGRSFPSTNRCATYFFVVISCFCHHIHFLLCSASERHAVVRCLAAKSGVWSVWPVAVLRILQWCDVYILS